MQGKRLVGQARLSNQLLAASGLVQLRIFCVMGGKSQRPGLLGHSSYLEETGADVIEKWINPETIRGVELAPSD